MTARTATRPTPRLVALTGALTLSMFSIGMLLASAGRVPPIAALGAGLALAVLTVFGLPSLGAARSALLLQGIAVLAVVRGLAVPGSNPVWMLPWAVGLVGTLVLAAGATATEAPLSGTHDPDSGRRLARAIALVSVVVLLAILLFGPMVASRMPSKGVTSGGVPALNANASLLSQSSLDTTVSLRLSNAIVMTVRSPHPSFWRGQLYDTWDGNTWTQSHSAIVPLESGPSGAGVVAPSADDLGATGGQTLTQTFHVVAPAASVIFAAPSPVEVHATGSLAQQADGSVFSTVMGPGASYTVVSRQIPVTAQDLADAAGAIPADIRSRYATRPVATARTVAAARSVTRGQATEFGKVEALEQWMGERTKYSIKAPPARKGVDVVDDFLFVTKRGWCEQIASSLVVLLRSIGVPARLATGFATGTPSRLTGEYTIRARDAHAWTEVWFPGVGWETFDPTAHVPLSGDRTSTSSFDWLRHHLLDLTVVLAAIGLVTFAVRRLRTWRAHRSPSGRRAGWAARALRRLEALGHHAHRDRYPHETATAYGGVLAELLDDHELAEVGRLIDDDGYRRDPVPVPDREAADEVLARAEHR